MKTWTLIAIDNNHVSQAEIEILRYKLQTLGLSEVRRNILGELRTYVQYSIQGRRIFRSKVKTTYSDVKVTRLISHQLEVFVNRCFILSIF